MMTVPPICCEKCPENTCQILKSEWHSHVSYQYTEGLLGALIVYNQPEVYAAHYDDELVIVLSDWYHTSGQTNSNWFLSPASAGNEPIPFSGLINGRGRYSCNYTSLPCDSSKQNPAVFNVQRGKRYRVRIINASAISVFTFSISGHVLNVIEVDGVDTIKKALHSIPIAPAQRYSVIVEMNGHENEYRISADISVGMFNFDAPNINPYPQALIANVTARLIYHSSTINAEGKAYSLSSLSSYFSNPSDLTRFRNQRNSNPRYSQSHIRDPPPALTSVDDFFPEEMELKPYDRISAPNTFHKQIVLNVEGLSDPQGVNHLTFNNIIYQVGDRPLLAQVLTEGAIPISANTFTAAHNQVIQIVINNHDTGPHPFHLHGHSFWVVGRGVTNAGDYNSSTDALRLNGVRRDTVVVNTLSWLVIRFVANNPGVWLLHCHINWHLQSGLAANIIEAADIARRTTEIPLEAQRICRSVGVEIDPLRKRYFYMK